MKRFTTILKFSLYAGFLSLLLFFSKINAQTFDHQDYHTAYGKVESIGDDSLVVNNTTFFVDSTTEIRSMFHSTLTFGDIRTGDYVGIMYNVQSDSTFLAEKIILKTQDNEFEVSGTVESIGSDSLVVHGYVFYTDSTTRVYGNHDMMITLSDISVGDYVEIQSVMQSDSSYFAERIKVETDYESEHDFIELEGTITNIVPDSLTVDGTVVVVDTGTVIWGDHHMMLTYADLMVGVKVEVYAVLQADSSYLAKKIRVEEAEKDQIQITGPVDTVYSSNVVVAGVTFSTDSTTEIYDSHHNAIALMDLSQGMIVRVHGVKVTDSTYHAVRIRVRDLWRPYFEVFGTIDSVGSDYIVVHNHRFFVDSNTEIYDSTNVKTDFASLSTGLTVKIKAMLQSDSTLLAKRIKVIGTHSSLISGTITSISGDTLMVSGLTVLVDSNTHYYNEADSTVTFADLQVNQQVWIRALKQSDGSYLALTIGINDDPSISKVSGTITAVTSNSISISSPDYMFTGSTVFLNAQFQQISSTSLSAGQLVTIWSSTSSQSSTNNVLQVQLAPSSVTNVKDSGNTLPKDFNLSQNYPNPFNPTTNIRYTIPKQSIVTLKVYDILGREVTTLVNSVKAPGTYQVTFNGANLASGVYIYRIKAGNFVAVKKLMLMK